MEDDVGVGALDVLEEGAVGWPGGVVEGEEDHPSPRTHRRGLSGDLDPGDPHLATAAGGEQVDAAGDPKRPQQRVVELHDVGGHVEPEHVELGAHLLGAGQLGQPGPGDQLGPVTEVEGELGRLGTRRDDLARRLRLGSGLFPDVEREPGQRSRAVLARRGDARHREASAAPHGPPGTAVPPLELGDVQQQVAAGDPTTPAEPTVPHPVQRVERPGEDEPLDDRAAHPGPRPEVTEVGVRLTRDDPGDLGRADPLDVGEGESDAVRLVRALPRRLHGIRLHGIRLPFSRK